MIKVFDNNDGYNEAYTALKAEAIKAAEIDSLQAEARTTATEEIGRLLKFLLPDREITIEFKK